MSPHRRLSPLRAAIQATTAAALPALVSASSSRSRSKHRHMHLHKDHHASSDSTETHEQHSHSHSHSHPDSHSHDDNTKDNMEELRRRDDPSAPAVTHVVQTVSVVQFIDAQGSIVTLSTAYTPSATQTEADLSVAGTTADSSDSTQTLAGTDTSATAAAATGATDSGSTGSTGSTSTAALTSGATAPTSDAVAAAAAPVTAAGSAFANGTATVVSVPLTTGPSTAATLTSNSASTHLFGNSTSTSHSLFANRTHTSSSVSSSFAYSSSYLSSSSASSSGYSSSLYSSATGSSSAYGGEATGSADGAGGAAGSGAATGSGVGAVPTSTSTDDDTSSNTPTSVLVGGVIGGLAGLAVLVVIALYFLKMKKKKDQSSHRLLTDGDNSGTAGAVRSIPSGPSGPSGSSGSSSPALGDLDLGMSEARPGFLAPFASALASSQKRMSPGRVLPALTAPSASDANANAGTYPGPPPASSAGSPGVNTKLIGGGIAAAAVAGSSPTRSDNGNASPTSTLSPLSPQSASSDSPTTERGFYRVSGRKLPSVLQHGGDGYDDPRQSVMSTNTVNTSYTANTGHMSMYRDSRGFFGGAGGPATSPASRYALGTPMRPESGVPVFHSGPGKLVSPMRAPTSRQGSFIQDDDTSVAGSARNLTVPEAANAGAGYFDPVGRSLISQDGSLGSRGSVSRFTEDIP